MPTPAEILADEHASPAEKLAAMAYIRRLIITPDQVVEALDLLTGAGIDPDDARTLVATFLTRISPYGRWLYAGKREGAYPTPEETFPGWTAITADIRTTTEGLQPDAAHEHLQRTHGGAVRLVSVLLDRL